MRLLALDPGDTTGITIIDSNRVESINSMPWTQVIPTLMKALEESHFDIILVERAPYWGHPRHHERIGKLQVILEGQDIKYIGPGDWKFWARLQTWDFSKRGISIHGKDVIHMAAWYLFSQGLPWNLSW